MLLKTRFIIAVGALIGLGVASWTIANRNGSPRRITQTTILSADGVRLSTIFDGLSPDAKYDLKNLPADSPPMMSCRQPSNSAFVERIKSWFQKTVYAQTTCTPKPCAGQQYVDQLPASTCSGCTYSYQYAYFDAVAGPYDKGIEALGT